MSLSLQVNGDIIQRIQAIVSGICWAEEFGIFLHLYWWSIPIETSLEQCFHIYSPTPRIIVHPGYIEKAISITSQDHFESKNFPLVIQSKHRFYEKNSEKWCSALRSLLPSPEIQRRLTIIPSKGAVALYIHGIPEQIVAKVLSLVWTDYRNSSIFLLSTDSSEIQKFFELMLPNRLFVLRPTSKFHPKIHTMDRLVDFFAFSQSTAIIDASSSQLCKLAGEYGGIPYISV